MLTIPQVIEYTERVIAEQFLAGNRAGLKNIQTAAGFLMAAANYHGDKDMAFKFQVLAAQAANKHEDLSGGKH